jgi:uncharacterized membrane protein SpoIIM required for sporulation
LDLLVRRGRDRVYAREPAGLSLRSFFARDYWRRVRERPWLLAAAVALLVVPTVLAFLWALHDPERAKGLLPQQFRELRNSSGDQGASLGGSSSIAAQIFTNNIRVSFAALALGMTVVGPMYLLIQNGATLGAVAGILTQRGNGEVAWTLVIAHGVLELSVIAVSAAAGMRMGMALVRPGVAPRGVLLRRATREAAEIVLGTIPWFVLAGLVEGFVTPAGFGPVVNGIVGVALGAVYWFLVWRLGRPDRHGPEQHGPTVLGDDSDDRRTGTGGLLVGGRVDTSPASVDDIGAVV